MDIHLFMWYLLIFTSVLILISAVDELFFDFAYMYRFIYRKYKAWRYSYQPLTVEKLCSIPEKKIAIMVPCWHEHLVIESMLKHNIPVINYKNYTIFVGVYPNDEPTVAAVQKAQKYFSNVEAVISDEAGPTTKAQNLNCVYKHILNKEIEKRELYQVFLFHDSEDIIHPLSLKLYNYLIDRKDMIQVPVFPLEVNHSFTTHWTYNDEFAENHTRTMLMREAIGGLVPSAGVGTAFSRQAMNLLAKESGGVPFNTSSFTEDYSVALKIKLLKLKSIFLTQKVARVQTKKRWGFFGKLVPKNVYELVATRGLFPTNYWASVRQRTRWILGITFQEWALSGWPGSFATRYTLFHDRKAAITHLINFLAYIVFVYWFAYYLVGHHPPIQAYLLKYPFVNYLLLGCGIIMLIRIFQRALATYNIYGVIAAFLSIPRCVYSNIINFHAIMRAYREFFFTPKNRKRWDKTTNNFPTSDVLLAYKKKLGDLLVENKVISAKQLEHALEQQKKEQQFLGKILVKNFSISPNQILEALAKQYSLEIVDVNAFAILTHDKLEFMPSKNYEWLIEHLMLPIAFYNGIVTLAIVNPADEIVKRSAEDRVKPMEVKFVLSSNAISYT